MRLSQTIISFFEELVTVFKWLMSTLHRWLGHGNYQRCVSLTFENGNSWNMCACSTRRLRTAKNIKKDFDLLVILVKATLLVRTTSIDCVDEPLRNIPVEKVILLKLKATSVFAQSSDKLTFFEIIIWRAIQSSFRSSLMMMYKNKILKF